MKIAVGGCAHGELDKIYSTIKEVEERDNITIDLLICCGDFQSSRNNEDLTCMAVPPKYRHICSFYKYFSGEKKAPVLTIFIGGNHEASNYLQELPYGGWVAPKIYYLGYAGIINIAGLRIGGISGIYKPRDFFTGRFEKPPYDENAKRSVYHIRNLEVFRLKQVSQPLDIFLSHDWPTEVYHYGNVEDLLKRKPYFKDEVDTNQLGSKPCGELLTKLKPTFWFSAHLHCKFCALIPHPDGSTTKFLALDKCLPRRKFLQIIDVPHDASQKIQIHYDLEWLSILFLTNHLLSVRNINTYMPGLGGNERYDFTPTEEEKSFVSSKMGNNLQIPKNFRPTAAAFQPGVAPKKNKQPDAKLNPQTTELCALLGIDDPICLISEMNGGKMSLDKSFYENSTFICDSDESNVVSDADENSEVKKVIPMKLPLPKTIESEPGDTNCYDNLSKMKESLDQSHTEIIPVVSPKRTLEHVEEISNSNNSESNVNLVQSTDILTVKKFKRRNADIYKSEENS
ncbi:lariat debranching enzyme [Euwallacea similis]|uniref:lariat debranching enzyme n=1 Tax=Euwallacea similis TaxID=1736056 RepID=UPI00344F18C0